MKEEEDLHIFMALAGASVLAKANARVIRAHSAEAEPRIHPTVDQAHEGVHLVGVHLLQPCIS